MDKKTYSYSIISLIICLTLALPGYSQKRKKAEKKVQHSERYYQYERRKKAEKNKKKEDIPVYPLYNGTAIGVDLWGPASYALGGDFLSSEISVSSNIRNKYFPTLEIGYGRTNTTNDTEIHYQSTSPYFRIGADYNVLYKKKFKHKLLVGLRYAYAPLTYDIDGPLIKDNIYGGEISDNHETGRISHTGLKGNMQWAEFCVGLRAHIWHQLYMGWTARIKFRVSSSSDQYGDPWYVPGFGEYNNSTIGLTYTITYQLPF